MTGLSREERSSLVEVADKILKGKEPTSITAYGSKVAGYARPDSDYDLIVTVRKFTGRVQYKYAKEPIHASALIVEDRLFTDDASKAYLGEFVSGRLLNVYEPILNDEFVRASEVSYKKRVIAESLLELSSEYGEFTQDLVFPMDYFLFDKLHKRAMIYPPALYSYVKTYTCDTAKENREFTLRGFAEAADSLASQGIVTVSRGDVKVVAEKMKGNALSRVLSLLNLTTRGVTQYAVHGFAGRVGPSVFKNEALSKLKRMREKVEPPEELQHPRRLLKLDEGVLFEGSESIRGELAKVCGFKDYKYEEKSLGQLYSTTKMVTLRGSEERKFVVKYFADIRSVKWALLGLWASGRKFSMFPQSRLHREYVALRKLKERGVISPAIVGVSLKEKILVRAYVEGNLLSDEIEAVLKNRKSDLTDVARYGRALAQVHRAGFAIGDAKASNVIIQNGKVYIADLEQSLENGDAAWDVAEFLYYTAKLSMKEEKMRVVADEFLKAYVDENGREIVARARNTKYLTPFRPFLTLPMVKTIREVMAKYS